MQIGELARHAGVNVQTVRFYERRGLLPAPARKDSGYRTYRGGDLQRLRFIRQAQRLGFSLDEIKSVLHMREQGACPCADVVAMAQRHLEQAESQIEYLSRFRDELARTLWDWKRAKRGNVSGNAICRLIERTMGRKGGKTNGTTKR